MKTIRITITGKVQGVFYRATAKEIATKLGLKGWIRNTSEGSVEAVVTGTDEQVDDFIKWCYKGPSRSKVDDVKTTELELKAFSDFTVVK